MHITFSIMKFNRVRKLKMGNSSLKLRRHDLLFSVDYKVSLIF